MRREDRGRGAGAAPDAGRTASQTIGEAAADEFAADVVIAGGEEAGVHDPDGTIAGATGGGTGIGDMAGGTGIGTDDAGGDDAGAGDAGTGGGTTGDGGR